MKIAVIADTHAPFHDPRAIALACKLVQEFQPEEVVHLADGIDFYAVSSFDRDPDRIDRLQEEIDSAIAVNRELASSAPGAAHYYLESGNHEARWLRYLWRHAEVSQLEALRFGNLLKMTETGWQLGGEEREYCGGRLVMRHGNRISKHSGQSARMALESDMHQRSVMIGHSHRQGVYMARGPRLLVAGWEVGCLCGLEPEYAKHPNWQQGLAFVTTGTGHSFTVELVTFVGTGRTRKAVWRGNEYTA